MIQIILLSLAMLACFIVLARIVDLFFISSLDKISHDLKLPSDVAGATLMAAGSSAPELFVALFSVLKPGEHQVIAFGSIVGSALFNILVIVGVVAFIKKAKLTWQPVFRDLIFYLLAVGLLLWSIWDGRFSMIEAIGFISIYLIYVLAVVKWKKILPYESPLFTEQNSSEGNKGIIGFFDKILQFIFPSEKKYILQFLISIAIIAALSWVIVEIAVQVSGLLNISEAIVALTVIAIGTSVPDLFSSVIVAKQGRGDMALSNAVGSNIFDILIGLGLPFMIFMIINGGFVPSGNDNLIPSSMALFASVILLFILLIVSKWKVGKLTGAILLASYVYYIVREIGIF